MISGSIIPPPEGVDVTTAEGLAGMSFNGAKSIFNALLAHLGNFIRFVFSCKISTKTSYAMHLVLEDGIYFRHYGSYNDTCSYVVYISRFNFSIYTNGIYSRCVFATRNK